MKIIIFITTILFTFGINAQNSYSELTNKAIKITNSNDSLNYNKAIKLLEIAFKNHPDSINGNGLYYASILNSSLNDKDKAFEYLKPLANMEKDEEGYPGWSYILEDFARKEYKNLLGDKRWLTLEKKALIDKVIFLKELDVSKKEFLSTSKTKLKKTNRGKKLYQHIKNYNPYLSKQQQDYSISFKINDSTKNSYFVHLPKNYNPKKKYAALVYLHGGVRQASLQEYIISSQALAGHRRFYSKHATLNNVVFIYISGSKKYNWMTPNDGFFIVPEIIKEIKNTININDNKIFISGHSNGATGSFSYAMKQPTPFASFNGFNTHPKVYTGGTFIKNILNRSFINISTDQDYYYPPNANDSLNKLMKNINADYKDYRYNGFPHWFPEFDESEAAHKIIFSDLIKRERNPFPKRINWEFDDNNYGNIDWLSHIKLDTLSPRASEHKNVNFKIKKWYRYNKKDSLIAKDVDIKAFDFPRKSGEIIADYQDNVFQIKTSCIKSLNINISPEMINLKKHVKVYINDKLYFNEKIKYDTNFMLNNFKKNKDKKQIWINSIMFKV